MSLVDHRVPCRSGSRLRAGLLVLVCSWGLAASGCVTTLGYVPEHLKPSDTATYIPTYAEVKKWAYDVVDGYDSRAIINRYAIYGGALVGASAIGAIAGLAAFDSGSSALIGIPIGTGFLASVAAIYSSEEKARIYGLGSRYVKDLITLSDQRLEKRRVAAQMTATALEEAQKALAAADRLLERAKQEEASKRKLATAARAAAEKAAEGPDKVALSDHARLAEELAAQAAGVVAKARAARDAAHGRVGEAERRHEAWRGLLRAKAKLAEAQAAAPGPGRAAEIEARQVEVGAAKAAWIELTRHDRAEALCLRDDINDVMRKVGEHVASLNPKNVVERLRAVGTAPAAKSEGDTPPAKLPPADLSDLTPPVKSRCDGAV